jgi:hypothetical protein
MSYESRQAYVDSNDLSDEVEDAILAGRVVVGMSKEDVKATWGWASETDTSEVFGLKGEYGKEYWYYLSPTGFSEEAEVYFNNGKVHSVSPTYLGDVPGD